MRRAWPDANADIKVGALPSLRKASIGAAESRPLHNMWVIMRRAARPA